MTSAQAIAAPFVIIYGAQTLWSSYSIQIALMTLTFVGARLAVDTVERQPSIQRLTHKERVMARFIAAMGIAGVAVSFGGLLGLTLTSYKLYAVALILFAAMDSTTCTFLQNAISTKLSAFSGALDYCIGRLATPPPHLASTTCTSGVEPKGTELPPVTQDELRKKDLFKRIYSSTKHPNRLATFVQGLNQVQKKDIDDLLKLLTLDSPKKLTALGKLLSAKEEECYPMCYAAVRAYLLGRLPKEDMLTFLLYVDAAQSLEGNINLLPVKNKEGAPNPEVVQLLVQSGKTSAAYSRAWFHYRLQKNVIEASEKSALQELCNEMLAKYSEPASLYLGNVVLVVVTTRSCCEISFARQIQNRTGFSFPFMVSENQDKVMFFAWHLFQYLIRKSTGDMPNHFKPNPVFGMSLIATMAKQLMCNQRDIAWPFPPLKSLYPGPLHGIERSTIDRLLHDIYHWAHLTNVDKKFVKLILELANHLRDFSLPLPAARAALTDIDMPGLVYPKKASPDTEPTLLQLLSSSFHDALREDILDQAPTSRSPMGDLIEPKSILEQKKNISNVADHFSSWIAKKLEYLGLDVDKNLKELTRKATPKDKYKCPPGYISYPAWRANCFSEVVKWTLKHRKACKFNLVDGEDMPTLEPLIDKSLGHPLCNIL